MAKETTIIFNKTEMTDTFALEMKLETVPILSFT